MNFFAENTEDQKQWQAYADILGYSDVLTMHYRGVLYSGNVNDDLFDEAGTALFIPENAEEKRSPRKEDAHLVYKLLEHLNSNLEHYNKVVWYNLDPDRRFMLLDGFNIQVFNDFGVPIGSRSLASVVKNELITITGKSLVFPVAAGYRVSQSFIVEQTGDGTEIVLLLDHYRPLTPSEPYRISVPTKGVFAEAVQGACNACERIKTDRLQDWNRFPNPDEPTPISPVSPPTPVVTDWGAAFKEFATPIVNIQNAPASPEPGAGLAGLSELLGKSGVFKDITGLDANQQNVIRTCLSNQENAKAFAEMAKEMAMQNHNTQNSSKIMDSINEAKSSGALNQEDYGKLVKDYLQQQIDGGETKKAELEKEKQSTPPPLIKAAVDAAGQKQDVSAQQIDRDGKMVSVAINQPGGGDRWGILQTLLGAAPIVKKAQATPTDPGWRACCALGQWKLGGSGALDPTKLGGHKKGGAFPDGPTGYVYTKSVGLIDLGHIRDLADTTKFIYDAFLSGARLLELYEGIASVFSLPPDQESALALTGAIAFVESWAHELITWPAESSFSPEDLCSNIIGIECAKRAIRTGGSFDATMDTVIDSLVNGELKAVSKTDTDAVLATIENDWFKASLIPPSLALLRRNFDGTPWMAGMRFDFPVSIPWLSPASFEPLYSEFSYKIKRLVDGKAGVTLLAMKTTTDSLRATFTAANPGKDKP